MSRYHGAVLAAGLGTRLRPLTNHLPKPLVPVAGRPLVEFGLDALARVGLSHIGINAYHLGDALPRALEHRPERLRFVHEEVLQGTGGGLRGVAELWPGKPLVVCNGDALHDFDLGPLLTAHEASGAVATLVLRHVTPESAFARGGVDANGEVHVIAEIRGPGADHATLRRGAYTGVQIVERSLLERLPATGPCDVLRTAYRDALADGLRVGAVFVPEGSFWLDVGTIQRYIVAHVAALDGRLPLPEPLSVHPGAHVAADAEIDLRSAVGCDASIGAGARLGPHVFVGHGAVVAPGADLERCVLWPGAQAVGHLRNQVVLPANDGG